MMSRDSAAAARTDAAVACLEAYRLCQGTVRHCLEDPNPQDGASCALELDDCADVNLLLANLISRNSPHVPQAAAFCAEVTRRTAESFSRIEHRDPQLRVAFAACQRVIRTCEELLSGRQAAARDSQDEAVEETFPASDATQLTSRL